MIDIAQYFPHLQERVMPHSMGQKVLSDWADMPDTVKCEKCGGVGRLAFPEWGGDGPGQSNPCSACGATGQVEHPLKLYKNCGFLNRDEAIILNRCAVQVPGTWLDIGAHTGWTALNIAAAGSKVVALDPMFANDYFFNRAADNINRAKMGHRIDLGPMTSRMYFADDPHAIYDGVMIDGDHCWGEPLYDAEQSFKHLAETGVILMHDCIGAPVLAGVLYLVSHGMKAKVYCSSSQLLAVCWRGDFKPPEYTPDPRIDWVKYRTLMTDFLFQEWK